MKKQQPLVRAFRGRHRSDSETVRVEDAQISQDQLGENTEGRSQYSLCDAHGGLDARLRTRYLIFRTLEESALTTK